MVGAYRLKLAGIFSDYANEEGISAMRALRPTTLLGGSARLFMQEEARVACF